MILVYPDFYPDFHCIASACRHSCCRGWEIDIDEDSFDWYKNMEGPFGERLRSSISGEPLPHFILREDESCPFLRKDGLCDMILELGEESLCGICTEHPRFYNEFPGRLEAGLGLCCEEAVRLLLEGSEPLKLVEEYEQDEETDGHYDSEREKIFSTLSDSTIPLIRRMENAAALTGMPPCRTAFYLNRLLTGNLLQETLSFYSKLETLDPCWRPMLEKLKIYADTPNRKIAAPDGIQYERLTEYFIYRHYAVGVTQKDRQRRLLFAFLSTVLISALAQALPDTGLPEIIRLYSSEIEYSDENVSALLDYIEEKTSKKNGQTDSNRL